METKLERIADKSKNEKRPIFTSLYHLINEELLKQCHKELDGNKAVGIDNVSKKEYEENLDENIKDLVVRLKNKDTGELVYDTIPELDQSVNPETETNANGEYQFDYVSISNLSNYYIEFEYDGLIYESVIPHLENEEKGSKAAEPEREEFNNRFTEMEKGNGETQVEANNGEENEPKVNYEVDTEKSGDYGRTLEMTSTENTEIIATTTEAGYNLEYDPSTGTTEITHINLGLYERAQTDLAIQTELEEIKAEINGYGHIYRYGPRYDVSNAQEVEDSWNLGIRYENKYKGTYERPIYEADAAYENTEDPSKELKLSLTYKITVRNQGTVFGKVNEIVAYYDSRYEIIAIGTEMNEKGNVESSLAETIDENYNEDNGYSRITIDTSRLNHILKTTADTSTGGKETQQSIYVQFNLPREVILDMLNKEEVNNKLSFTAEIGSYTSYSDKDGKKQ